MKIGIIGTRRWPEPEHIRAAVFDLPPDAIIVSGGAAGPDTWAINAARERGMRTIVHIPEKPTSRTRWAATEAFYARNQLIVDDADELLAFVSADRKGGTEDTIRRAKKKGIPVRLFPYPGQS